MKWQRWFRTLHWTILEYGRFWSPKNHSPNAFSPSWVSSYRQNAPGASQSTLTNFKFGSPNFHLQKCLETAGETVKLLRSTISKPKKWRKNTFRKWAKGNVALSLCTFRSLCSLVTHSAQYCYISTVFHDILRDGQQSFYIHQRDSTFCLGAPAVVCQKPLRGEIGAPLRGHFERPNMLATFHLQLQLSRFQEPPRRQIGAVQKISNCKKLQEFPIEALKFHVQ